jgi:hypothetical protein
MDIDKLVAKQKTKSLSSSEVKRLCNGKVKIITYPELTKYKTLDQLLKPYGAIIILYLTSENYGHWVACFMRDKKNVEFFDSYGLIVDSELKFAPQYFRKEHNMVYPHLTYLLLKSGYKVHYNNHKLQSDKRDTSTCGRHCAVRIMLRHLKIEDYVKLLKNEYRDPDYIVTALTLFI